MRVSRVVAAIASAAAIFVLRFVIALLREGPPAVCYRVVPIVGWVEKHCHRKVSSGVYADEDRCAPEDKRSDYYVGLLENEKYV